MYQVRQHAMIHADDLLIIQSGQPLNKIGQTSGQRIRPIVVLLKIKLRPVVIECAETVSA